MPTLIGKQIEWREPRKKISKIWKGSQPSEEQRREEALFGRTVPVSPEIKEFHKPKFNPDEGMTTELYYRCEKLDELLHYVTEEEDGKYLIAIYLGFEDDPHDQKIINDYEAKYNIDRITIN